LPDVPKEFLKQFPTAWDDIRFIDGDPGKFAVIARKNGENWYVGGISGEKKPLTLNVGLFFLDDGAYSMTFIGDGNNDKSFESKEESVHAGESIMVNMRARGGFVMKIVKIQ